MQSKTLSFSIVVSMLSLSGCISGSEIDIPTDSSWVHADNRNSHSPSCSEAKQVAELIEEQTGVWTVTRDLKACYQAGYSASIVFSGLDYDLAN